ncbi:hypothetical protein [Kitasatospora aureofaciens]|uniref:hypothetical protein n=1 Tax=Kitasatospora aureofaciens TaxID=1894 RepID=UPI001C47B5C1|nr:hypothetical protein [Kitasatospora aureofaciens]MBV6697366.1 hypothetical protein [Kitasatospora aureofaciens]
MTRTEQEYRELWQLSHDERRSWVRGRFPEGASPQWWLAMVESAETGVSPVRELPDDQRREGLEFAVSLVELALDEGGMSPCYSAYWTVRLAALALRFRAPIDRLPEVVTPDGAARLALRRLPLSREELLAAASRRRNDLQQGEDRFYVPGEDISESLHQPSEEVRLLQEVERVLSSLVWIADHIVDEQLSRDIQIWLDLRSALEI